MPRENQSFLFRDDSRAISEVIQFSFILAISFTFVFGSVVAAVGHLDGVANDQSEQLSQDELTNVQGSLYGTATNAPYQTASVELTRTSLGYGDQGEVKITVGAQGPSGSVEIMTVPAQPQVLSSENNQIVVEHGAVIYDAGDGSSMVSPPRFEISQNRTIIPLFNTSKDGGLEQASGAQEVEVVSYQTNRTTAHLNPIVSGNDELADVEITVESPRYLAWRNYFEDLDQVDSVTVNPDTETVVATFQTHEIVMQDNEVGWRIDG